MTEDTDAEADEVTGEKSKGSSIADQNATSKKRPNACIYSIPHPLLQLDILTIPVTELMSKKPKPTVPSPTKPKSLPTLDGLNIYIQHPESFPPDRVLSFSSSFVLISDLFPKSTVHLLLLPRDPSISLLHPFKALSSPSFLSLIRTEISLAVQIASSSLRQRYGSLSASDAPRREALASADPPDILPEGRDWSEDIKVGVHAHPSMRHLHIHILSRDMLSPCMKHAKHYLSFNSPFFVELERFPLDDQAEGDREGWLKGEMKCWRCGRGFGRRFRELKEHLLVEGEEWKRL